MVNPVNLRTMSNEEFNVLKLVASKYLHISPNAGNYRVLANTCVDLDKDAKKIIDELAVLRKSQDKQLHIDFLMFANKKVLDKFNQYDCRNRIEETRIDTAGSTSTKFAIKSEQSVLGKSNKEVNGYIIIGSLVLVSVLVILLTNKK
jgi:hypothetical protein